MTLCFSFLTGTIIYCIDEDIKLSNKLLDNYNSCQSELSDQKLAIKNILDAVDESKCSKSIRQRIEDND